MENSFWIRLILGSGPTNQSTGVTFNKVGPGFLREFLHALLNLH